MFILRIRESGFTDGINSTTWRRIIYTCPGCSKQFTVLLKNGALNKPPFVHRQCTRCFYAIPDLEFITRHVATRVRYHNSISQE